MVDIKQQMKSGLFWTAIDKYSGQVIALFISMVLARLLTPADFGVVATATVILNFLTLLSTIGVGPAVIQRKDLSQDDIDNIFTFTFYVGLFFGLVAFISSWFIADFYESQILRPIVQILSFGILFSSINIVPSALMSKNMRFKEKAVRSLSFQLIFGIIGIISAFYGAGVYALICPTILSTLCTFFYYNYYYRVHFRCKMSLLPIKKIFSYSVYVFLTDFFGYFSGNLDKLIIGKSISPQALGYYEKSYRLMLLPIENITTVINPVLQPVFSNLQDDISEMANKYNKIVSVIATLGFPMAVILYFCAYEIVVVMFGSQWEPAVPAFKILTLSVPFILLCKPHGPMCLACNASKRMFYVGMVNSIMTITSIFVCAFYVGTIEAIAWGRVIVCVFILLNCYHNLYVKIMNISLFSFVKAVVRPFVTVLILIFVYVIFSCVIPLTQWNFINLLAKLFIGLITFCVCFETFGDKTVLSLIKRK